WRIIAAVAVAAPILGAVTLYLQAFLLRWTGRLLGGKAPQVQLRSALAWSWVPVIATLPIIGVAYFVMSMANHGQPHVVTIALELIALALGLWSIVAAVLMLGRVQGFGLWRAIGSYVLS